MLGWLKNLPLVRDIAWLRRDRVAQKHFDALQGYCSELNEGLGGYGELDLHSAACVNGYMETVFFAAHNVCFNNDAPPAQMFDLVLRRIGSAPDQICAVRWVAYLLAHKSEREYDPAEGH